MLFIFVKNDCKCDTLLSVLSMKINENISFEILIFNSIVLWIYYLIMWKFIKCIYRKEMWDDK